MSTPTRVVNGTALRIIRELTGISLRELAGRCDISPGHLSRIERGEPGGQASPQVTRQLADKLGVPIAAITYPMTEQVAS
jgi:transcriptional regulator with XRE-family HTH domain